MGAKDVEKIYENPWNLWENIFSSCICENLWHLWENIAQDASVIIRVRFIIGCEGVSH